VKKLNYDRIMTTIEREWLAEIIAGTKKIEYRQNQTLLDESLREGPRCRLNAHSSHSSSPSSSIAEPPSARKRGVASAFPTHVASFGVRASPT